MSRARLFLLAVVPLVALATLALLSAQTPIAVKKVAVLVGVKSYRHSSLPDLEYTERDVSELAKLLEPAGYKVSLLTTAAGADQDKPTAANIRTALASALKDVGKGDTVLVAFAGHGVQPDGAKESYFCPHDANPTFKDENGTKVPTRPATLVGLSTLVNELNDSGVGVKLLFVDACRNDPTPGRGRGVDGSSVASLPKGVAALFSCSVGQRAFETSKAGGGHGVFFHFVLEGLRGKAGKNDRGEITWNRLAEYVQENVEAKTPEWIGDARQVPHEVKNLEGRSPAIVSGVMDVGDGKTYVSKATGMKFLRIKAGTFMMGSPKSEEDHEDDEVQHEVTLTKDYYLGVYEVTQKEWRLVMGTTPWSGKEFVKEGDDYPAVYVSWEDAMEYAKKLSEKDGHAYRLPTEAEWEYACRGGSKTAYSFGDAAAELKDHGWFDVNAWDVGEKYAHRVGLKRANGFGLYDMHGNVWEWCSDWSKEYESGRVTDPTGPASGSNRVFRGGGWSLSNRGCRSAYRSG